MKDGGPAFPRPGVDEAENESLAQSGMSLRDWFAGQALAGLTADPERFDKDFGNSSIICYRYADAMLAQREKR